MHLQYRILHVLLTRYELWTIDDNMPFLLKNCKIILIDKNRVFSHTF